jgi:hypothetical protein
MPENELPELVRFDAQRFGRGLARQFPELRNNPKLAREVGKIVAGELCPRKPAGRPPRPEVTRAEELHRRLRKQFKDEDSNVLWERICAEVLPDWAGLRLYQKAAAKRKLKNQLAARRAARRKRKRVRRQRKQSA